MKSCLIKYSYYNTNDDEPNIHLEEFVSTVNETFQNKKITDNAERY